MELRLIMLCWAVKLQWEQKGFLFCRFWVPVIWTSAHGASVRTLHTRHAQGPLKYISLCVTSVGHRTSCRRSMEVGNNEQAAARYSCFISSFLMIYDRPLVSPFAFSRALTRLFETSKITARKRYVKFRSKCRKTNKQVINCWRVIFSI